MLLSEKLLSIPDNTGVAEISSLLDKAHPKINWLCQRTVTVEGYEGSVGFELLAKKFLGAKPNYVQFRTLREKVYALWNLAVGEKPEPMKKPIFEKSTLQERLDTDLLWKRLEKLSSDSFKLYGKLRILAHLMEFRPWCRACCEGNAVARLASRDFHSTGLFDFRKEDFKKLWPDVEPISENYGLCEASEEMIKTALKNNPELETVSFA